jgi:hypothetical protein
MHKKLLKELQDRDLKDVKSDKLLDMLLNTSDKIEDTKGKFNIFFRTDEQIEAEREG